MHYIFWFRKDLRLTDNRALSEFIKAVSNRNTFSFLYIKNKNLFRYFGEKRISFLIESLSELKEDLQKLFINLQIIEGRSIEIFKQLIKNHKKISLYMNAQVEPYCIGRDNEIKELIESNKGEFNIFNDSTIFDFGEVKNNEGNQYKVFTPFKNQALYILTCEHYKKADCNLSEINVKNEIIPENLKVFDIENEYVKLSKSDFLKGGRKNGIKLLKQFYDNGLDKYKSGRDFPSIKGTSLLSAHLHFGTVGIREAFRTAINKSEKAKSEKEKTEIQTWINELVWREFYYQITFHNPQLMFESFKKEYDKLKWNYNEEDFKKWCEGKTGYPIVDAGMRQLKKEGWMHNRVRMITAMFLTKDLFIDWRWGEKYFAENLIDLDFSSNNGGWQWSASTGVDAQPYFRIFNPYLQSKKFDSKGDFIRKYVPEISSLPPEFIHEPQTMNTDEQKKYNVIIGKDYPAPMVDHKASKDSVLREFKKINEAN
ncbi:MAG TPA: deoxyribodipyrimidine photo-lyase [Ignavibacteria bacterium]|nr:deoxyribodipyrimidine photo-lyase [Ignavibacteria bacterium]